MTIFVTVMPDSQDQMLRASEVMARAIIGLALDGIDVSLGIHEYVEEDEDAEV